MGETHEPRLVLRLAPRNGFSVHTLDERRVSSYSIDSAYLTPTDGFRITVYDQDPANLVGLVRQPIEIVVDGTQQMIGQIDQVSEGDNGTAVTLIGRDYMADIVEDRINPAVKVSEGMSVADTLLVALGQQGITSVEGPIAKRNVLTGTTVGNTTAPRDLSTVKMKEYKAAPGEGLFAYCNRIVARHGATIQPGTARSHVVVGAPDFGQAPSGSIRRTINGDNISNVIGTPQCDRDWSSVPTVVIVTSKQGVAGEEKVNISYTLKLRDFAPDALKDLSQEVLDSIVDDIHVPGSTPPDVDRGRYFHRLLYQLDDECRNQEQLERLARRLMSDRLRETLKYEVTLQGHRDPSTGATYSVDTVLDVDDEICHVHERMWVARRTLEFTKQNGATTKLELWRLNSFLL